MNKILKRIRQNRIKKAEIDEREIVPNIINKVLSDAVNEGKFDFVFKISDSNKRWACKFFKDNYYDMREWFNYLKQELEQKGFDKSSDSIANLLKEYQKHISSSDTVEKFLFLYVALDNDWAQAVDDIINGAGDIIFERIYQSRVGRDIVCDIFKSSFNPDKIEETYLHNNDISMADMKYLLDIDNYIDALNDQGVFRAIYSGHDYYEECENIIYSKLGHRESNFIEQSRNLNAALANFVYNDGLRLVKKYFVTPNMEKEFADAKAGKMSQEETSEEQPTEARCRTRTRKTRAARHGRLVKE